MGPVTTGHLQEVENGRFQVRHEGAMARHGAEQTGKLGPHRVAFQPVMIAEDVSGLVNPAIGRANRGPERVRFLQGVVEDRLQTAEFFRTAPFFVTRSKLVAISERRF